MTKPYRFGDYWRIDLSDGRYIKFVSDREAWDWYYDHVEE